MANPKHLKLNFDQLTGINQIMASFKTDESFLEKISIGAIGTQQVFSVLRQLGHQPIELERGSMNYKIWKKI